MIDKRKYYNSEHIPSGAKKRVWGRISEELFQTKEPKQFQIRSFAFGAVSIIVAYFFALGVFTLFNNSASMGMPEDIRINNAYLSAINEFEKIVIRESPSQEIEVDELMKPRLEKINSLNRAIAEFGDRMELSKYEPVKEERLRALYALKLHTLQELIDLEGKSNEKD